MFRLTTLILVATLLSGCAFTTRCTETHGLTDLDGQAFTHQITSSYALHWLFGAGGPIVGDASLESTVATFTETARDAGDTTARIVQSSTSSWWWVLPPITFIITPVSANVAGDVR